MTKDEALKMIKIELDGIANTQSEYDDGWWETSTGAEFGKERLNKVLKIIEALEQRDLYSEIKEGFDALKQPAQEPFGYWHVGETEEECDFFLHEDNGDVSEYCDTCIKLYTHPAPSWQECENLKHDLEECKYHSIGTICKSE